MCSGPGSGCGGGDVFISQVVQAELPWVLATAFEFDRAEIAMAMRQLRDNMAFRLQNQETFAAALVVYGSTALECTDCLILVKARSAQA